jgi:hypothetical protein
MHALLLCVTAMKIAGGLLHERIVPGCGHTPIACHPQIRDNDDGMKDVAGFMPSDGVSGLAWLIDEIRADPCGLVHARRAAVHAVRPGAARSNDLTHSGK